ncbi:MAG: TMEM175 family protein [Methanomicrobiales archaeon]
MVEISSEGPVTKVNVGRLTNAIFVFTLLLLFRNVKTPTWGDYIGNATANDFGLMQLPDILNFLNAFIIIAMLWVVLFNIFNNLQKIDRVYLYLHLITLMMVIFIPVSSHLNVVFPGRSVFPLLFNLNMLVIGVLLFFEWWHISRKPSIQKPGINSLQKRCIGIKMLYIPVTAVVGAVLSTFDLQYTQSVYFITMIAFALTTFYFRNRKEPGGIESI